MSFAFTPILTEPNGTLAVSFSQERKDRNWECFAKMARRAGVTTIVPRNSIHSFTVEASYAQIAFLFERALTNRVEAGCFTDGVCQHCATQPLATCGDDPFCSVGWASRLASDRSCYQTAEPVFCMHADQLCGAAVTYARDPQGQCWVRGDNCLPPSWSEASECQPPESVRNKSCVAGAMP